MAGLENRTADAVAPRDGRGRPLWADLALLCLVVGLSTLPYIGGLGFYSDDWGVLAFLDARRGEPFLEALGEFAASQPLVMRPAQAAYFAVLHRLFGLDPMPHHLVNAAVLMAMAATCLLALRELKAPPALALAVSMLFALLPHYSTDRMWFVAFQIPLSIALYFLSLFAELRALRGRPAPWKALSLACIAVSLLLYELALPLIVAQAALLTALKLRARSGPRPSLVLAAAPQFAGVALAAAIAVYKSRVTDRLAGGGARYVDLVKTIFAGDYDRVGDYGFNIGAALWTNYAAWGPKALAAAAGSTGLAAHAVAGLIALLAFLGLRGRPLGWRAGRLLLFAAGGVGLLALGYGVFLLTDNIQFTPAGVGNRVGVIPALGVAATFVGLAAAASVPAQRLRAEVFALLLALACGLSSLLVSGIGARWVDAYDRQKAVLAAFGRDVGRLTPGATNLLAGVCPYAGPAPVFEADWDWPPLLGLTYHVPYPAGDVIVDRASFRPDGVVVVLYGEEKRYPYGPALRLYDPGLKAQLVLDSPAAARRYLALSARRPACPPSAPGHGAPLF